MNFSCEHLIVGAPPEAYETLFFDEVFNEALCKEVGLKRVLVLLDRSDKQITREVACIPEREIPGPIARVLGADRFSYTERVSYRLGTLTAEWKTTPSTLQSKVDCHGRYVFSHHPSGTLRRVEGEVHVKLFGLGGAIERFIIGDIEQSFARAAAYTCAYLKKSQSAI